MHVHARARVRNECVYVSFCLFVLASLTCTVNVCASERHCVQEHVLAGMLETACMRVRVRAHVIPLTVESAHVQVCLM